MGKTTTLMRGTLNTLVVDHVLPHLLLLLLLVLNKGLLGRFGTLMKGHHHHQGTTMRKSHTGGETPHLFLHHSNVITTRVIICHVVVRTEITPVNEVDTHVSIRLYQGAIGGKTMRDTTGVLMWDTTVLMRMVYYTRRRLQ